MDLSLVSVDSTTVRAHHDAAGMHLDADALAALEKAAEEADKARQKGAARRNKTDVTTRNAKSGDASDVAASSV
ncbi:hypothetical protein GCM10018790_00540 [Kitasatospora xanthocidica]|nr:hypothetical protein GCM10018790_00540 [Kitasatospora xanthocidica]